MAREEGRVEDIDECFVNEECFEEEGDNDGACLESAPALHLFGAFS